MVPRAAAIAYATTSGAESAFSYTTDGDVTWKQAGLIDTRISDNGIIDLAVSPNYSQDDTLFLLTFDAEHIEQVVVTEDEQTTLTVNGKQHKLEIEPYWSLAYLLREKLGLTGLRIGCDRGECGHYTVLVDGRNIYSCLMLAIEAEGMEITTIEGLSDGITLHPIQQAFHDHNAFQCGWCTPGFIMSVKALLAEIPNPTLDQVKEGLAGHVCVCGGAAKVVGSVLDLAGRPYDLEGSTVLQVGGHNGK